MRMQGSGAAVSATVTNNVRSAVARMAGYGISCLAPDPGNPAHVWCLFFGLGARLSLHISTTNQPNQHGRGRI
jgi:hypothetical protein